MLLRINMIKVVNYMPTCEFLIKDYRFSFTVCVEIQRETSQIE